MPSPAGCNKWQINYLYILVLPKILLILHQKFSKCYTSKIFPLVWLFKILIKTYKIPLNSKKFHKKTQFSIQFLSKARNFPEDLRYDYERPNPLLGHPGGRSNEHWWAFFIFTIVFFSVKFWILTYEDKGSWPIAMCFTYIWSQNKKIEFETLFYMLFATYLIVII